MQNFPRRKLTLLDLVVVVASIAAGLALLRWRLAFADVLRFFRTISDAVPWEWSAGAFSLRLSGLLDLATPCALTGTFGVLILRLLPPRPRLPRLARQPGFVACVTYLAVAVFTTVTVLVTLQTRGKLGQLKPIDVVAYYMVASELAAHLGGLSVAVAWSVLWMNGRYRPEACWVDRLGRLLGFYWIASGLVLSDVHNSVFLGL